MMKISFIVLIFVFIAKFTVTISYIIKPANLTEAPYDIWAHYHWIWLGFDDENQDSIKKLVDDYRSYDIPVGAVNLDSSWPIKYENFIWNPDTFQNGSELISYLHSFDLKVTLWITSMINNDSSNFNEGKQKGYFLNDGKLVDWRHGFGAFLDYSYQDAVDWWHKQMDMVLDIGIDGWKCDGTDPFVMELIVPRGHKGVLTHREYADYYYRDFFYYTRQKRGDYRSH